MKNYKLDWWLNKNFKNTECNDFLNYLRDSNQILDIIKWADTSYALNEYGAEIKYEMNFPANRDIVVDIKYLSKNYHIEIKEYGSKFIFYDVTNLSKTRNKTKVTTIKVFKAKNYYLDVKDYDNHNQSNQKLKHHTNLSFSSDGALISYIDEEIDYKNKRHQQNLSTRPQQFKKKIKKYNIGYIK